jgi:hypothetical protein
VAAQWIMTRRKQGQRTLWEGIVDEDVRALWEPWMIEADEVLEDEELIEQVFEAQGKRYEYSATKGPVTNTGRNGFTSPVAQACPQLELRCAGA